jgi:3-oxoacid CoA-transferase B subunit
VNVTVLGSYEVAENGDFANWKTAGRKGGGIGGAMDLAVGAQRVWIAMEHTTRDGKPRLLKRCFLPVTAVGVVQRVVTDLGLFDVTPEGFVMREIAPGYTPEEVQAVTEAKLIISPDLKPLKVT